jgi:ABC-type nitrate/sulfonate/bicarbonate transport system substrate-binding protein
LNNVTWAASPQETLLGILQRKEADAVVLLDHFFYHGVQAEGVDCLYTDGDAWRAHTGFDEMIKHIVAASAPLMEKSPALHGALLQVFRDSFAYSERNMEEVADVFLARYGGDKEALLASARYPRMEFTFTPTEQKLALREMEMFVEIERLPRMAPLNELFLF